MLFKMLSRVLILGVFLLSATNVDARCPDVRPDYTGSQLEAYRRIYKEVDDGMRQVLQEDFARIKVTLGGKYPKVAAMSLDLGSNRSMDMFVINNGQPVITIGQGLRWAVFRVAQANVATALLPFGRIDKETGLARYANAIVCLHVRKDYRDDPDVREARPPEVGEFFGLSDEETIDLANSDAYRWHGALQWQSTMRALLLHEVAHVALGHSSASGNSLQREIDADSLANRLLLEVWPDDLNFPFLAKMFYAFYFCHRNEGSGEDANIMWQRMGLGMKQMLSTVQETLRRHPDIAASMQRQGAADLLALSQDDLDAMFKEVGKTPCAEFR